MTDNGPEVMLPPEYIDAVNAENKLSFTLFIKNVSSMISAHAVVVSCP